MSGESQASRGVPFPPYPGPLVPDRTWEALKRYAESLPMVERIVGVNGIDVQQQMKGEYVVQIDPEPLADESGA